MFTDRSREKNSHNFGPIPVFMFLLSFYHSFLFRNCCLCKRRLKKLNDIYLLMKAYNIGKVCQMMLIIYRVISLYCQPSGQ